MRIAPTARGDIPALQAIEAAAGELFRGTGLVPFPAEGAPRVMLAEEHEDAIAAGLSFTALEEDEPAGFAAGIWHPDSAYLAELSVDPRFGRRGVGRALVEHFCEQAAARGARAATLSTFRDPPWNAPFYARLGFIEIAKADYADWMRGYEINQTRAGLDIAKRLFMRRAL